MPGRNETMAGRSWIAVFTISVLLVLSMPPARVVAQDAGRPETINPLRPADTSSPRDTLRSFLTSADELARQLRDQGPLSRMYQLLRAARETLDLRTTAYGASWGEQIKRVLLLHEILGRVELPPFDQIPGDEDVAAGEPGSWTIPNTRIRIVRIDAGPEAGEYLFSAGSVERLDIAYRRAKHIPYKPGAFGVYEEYMAAPPRVGAVRSDEIRERMRGLDASSPRETLEGFLESVNQAYRLVSDAEARLNASPPTITANEARRIEQRAGELLRLAASALDLSEVAAVRRKDVGIEAALLLKETLDRMVLPPIEFVPDGGMVAAGREQTGPYRWRIPGTVIEIVEIAEGEQAGEYVFSAETVARMDEIYAELRSIPYRATAAEMWDEYRSPGLSKGFYEAYISTPGQLVPSATLLGRLVNGLPDWLKTQHAGQTRWQWIGLLVCALAALLAGALVFPALAALARRLRSPWDRWTRVPAPALAAAIVKLTTNFADDGLNITGHVLSLVRTVAEVAVLLLVAWTVWRILAAVAETVIASPRISDQGIDASLIRIVSAVISLVIAIWIVVAGLRDLGVDAVPLLAGLGVGGLAGALAIRPTLENLIGGLILFIDKPVRVGDYCVFGGMDGTVENIGIRSTQIRALDRTLISVPNAKFADMEIVNWARCDRMMIESTIGLRYETDPDQLRHVLAKMREMFHAHPKIDRGTVRVRFAGYGESSLDVGIRVYALTRDWNEYHAIREDVFLRINDIVTESGTGFAFPSRTLYMSQDEGLDTELGKAAVHEVKAWRKSGKLPFPRFSPEKMDQLEDTLDYPPRGSVEAGLHDPQWHETAEPLSAEPEPEQPEEAEEKAKEKEKQ